MSHGSLRLRLHFDRDLTSDALHSLTRYIMYLPPFLPPDIGGLASLIQCDFGISEPQGLALSIDQWRLPLCSSTAVLQNNDSLKVARSTGPEPSLQISGSLPWAGGLPAVPGKQATEREGTLAIEAVAGAPLAQLSTKKRKREQTHATKEPAQKTSVPLVTPTPASESDSSEESESETEESSEEDEVPAKRPSRNARRKKHKRQLKRLGLLEGKPGRSGSTPSNQKEQQAGQPQAAIDKEADRAANNKRRRAEEPPARSQQEEAKDQHERGHAKLPKRGEQWQQSADVAEFMQKGHVHFMDSDSGEDASRAQEAFTSHQHVAQMPPSATNGRSKEMLQQRPEQAPVRECAQPPRRVERTQLVDYDALPKPQPCPLEGDVIAYRLLHIGADWTPQVSEWREGRILSLDTAQQSVVVEPWGQNRDPHSNGQAQNGDAFGDEDDEEEQPPTEYDDDGILTTSLHSFADLRIIKDMASSVHGTGAKERWRQQVESVSEDAEEPVQDGVDGVGRYGRLPPPPLVNGMRPGPGHTASARPAQQVSTPVSKPVSRHTAEQKQKALARPERSQHHAEGSQRAQVAAESSQPASAQQARAEHSASQPMLAQGQRPKTLPDASMAGNGKAAPATRSMPAAEAVHPTHSPLGPPVLGGAAGRSPAGFAQVAAALKARRAELAARQKALAAPQQASLSADNRPLQVVADLQSAPAQTPAQSRPPAKSVQGTPILEQATDKLAELPESQAGGQLEAADADAIPAHNVSVSAALASQPEPAVDAEQQHDSGVVWETVGVKTRSAARQEEHSAMPIAPNSSPGTQASHRPGSVTERSHKEGTPEGTGQVHTKRPRASTRGSLIGPLLARLRREEEAAATVNGTGAV